MTRPDMLSAMRVARRSVVTFLGAAGVSGALGAVKVRSSDDAPVPRSAGTPAAPVSREKRTGIPLYPELRGKIALVTGGSGLIGSAACRALAANNVRVVVNGRDASRITPVVETIRSQGGEAMAGPADCMRVDELTELRNRIEQQWGPVDALLAFAGGAAGGQQARPKPIMEVSESEWREGLEENLTTTFLTLRVFLPPMLERKRGAVVTMSSAGGRQAPGAPIPYGVAKAGVIMLTRLVAAEVGPARVRVNCLAPSIIRAMGSPLASQIASYFPLRRLGRPSDVVGAALFLLSDSASWITGTTLDVAGGRVML